MALQEVLSKKLAFPAGKSDSVAATTLDHVMRIHKDHDYTRSTFPGVSKDGDMSVLKGNDETDLLNDQEIKDDFEVLDGVCDYQKSKTENEEQLPKEGIEASDMSSLLEQFLEYEKANNQSTSLLTPATSPGHFESWNDQVPVKMDSHLNSTDLTPPSTPPVLEVPDYKTDQMCCNASLEKQLKRSNEELAMDAVEDAKLQQKRKLEDVREITGETNCADFKKARLGCEPKDLEEGLAMSESDKRTSVDDLKESKSEVNGNSNQLEENGHEEEVLSEGEVNEDLDTGKSKRNVDGPEENKDCEMNEKLSNDEDRSPSEGETKGNHSSSKTNGKVPEKEQSKDEVQICDKDDRNNNCERERESELYRSTESTFGKCERAREDERRRRRHYSRRPSSEEEDSSDDERYDPRKCEQSKKRHRESSWHSDDRERRHGRRDGRTTREHSEYDYNSNRRHYDDKRKNYRTKREDRKPWNEIRDIEQERKINFRLGRSKIKDIAKEERRVVYVGGLPYGTTRDELWEKFRRFGPVEKVTVHLREGERDNYGFLTFFEPEDARECIERGNSDPNEPHLDLCFGGRRQYCGGSYVDFDSKTSHIEELSETYGNIPRGHPEEEDFDSLLRKYQEETRPGKSR